MPLGIPILAYHFTNSTSDAEDAPYTLAPSLFDQHLQHLQSRSFDSFNLSDLWAQTREAWNVPAPKVVITFDDGRECCYSNAFPLLRKYHLTATIFLISSRVGRPGFLSVSQIREMQRHGFTFESHSMTHPRLASLAESEAKAELERSKVELEAMLGEKVSYFAYPFGSFDERVKSAVREAGYAGAVCSRRGLVAADTDRYALPRMNMRYDDTLPRLRRKLAGAPIHPLQLWISRAFGRIRHRFRPVSNAG
jgi:peptidoglycan/xylan/chitin deacetylase (PgdA/CDA1 family)